MIRLLTLAILLASCGKDNVAKKTERCMLYYPQYCARWYSEYNYSWKFRCSYRLPHRDVSYIVPMPKQIKVCQ